MREYTDHLQGQTELTPKAEAVRALKQLCGTYRTVCGTGHRPQDIEGYQDRDFPVLTRIAEVELTKAQAQVVIAGGAIGWDQAFAQAALNLGLMLVVAVPFAGQHRRWRKEDQLRYGSHLEQATIAYACADPAPDDRRAVVDALLGRNVEMLRYASAVIPFHSGKESGGTYHCLTEAKKRGIPALGQAFQQWEAYQRGEWPVIHHVSGTPLSNFQSSPIRVSGVSYPTLEHAYQASKTLIPAEREQIAQASSPAEAKKLGQDVTLREGWNELRLTVMEGLLRVKFRDPAYRAALLATGDALIIEGNHWNDTFFGVCRGLGENHLGRLLMNLRNELRA